MRIPHTSLYLFCWLVLLASCKKPDENRPCPEPTFTKICPALQDYLFTTGSQWIYQNAADSSLDTVTQQGIVESTYRREQVGGTGNMTGGCPVAYRDFEQFQIAYLSSRNPLFWEYVMGQDIYGATGELFFCESTVGATYREATVEAYWDSLRIGAHTFHHVTQIYATSYTPYQWPRRLFYAPSVGVIRKEIFHGTILDAAYDLIDWNVTRYPYQ